MKRTFTAGALFLCTLAATAQVVADSTLSVFSELCKKHIYTDFKQMYKPPIGGVLKYPFITPGSQGYANVLWDWDSWLSDVALQQILHDRGSVNDKKEALPYEQGCILNYLYYTGDDGYMPICIDAATDPLLIKPENIYATNMHKPIIAQHAAFLIRQNNGDAEWLKNKFGSMMAFISNYKKHHWHEATGLFFWQDDLAIGVDTDPSTFFRPKGSSASIFLNCLMYKELKAMAYSETRVRCMNTTTQTQAHR